MTDDQTLRQYLAQVSAEAELAKDDLDEIEDHLRTLANELGAADPTSDSAMLEACRRMGDPRAVAREHARVRSAFGTRLAHGRAWGAALLLLPALVSISLMTLRRGTNAGTMFVLVLGVSMLLALTLRSTWARAFVLGVIGPACAWMVTIAFVWGGSQMFFLETACCAAALALLVPWQRRELTGAGAGLALVGPAWYAASLLLAIQMTRHGGAPIAAGLGAGALACAVAAGLGSVLRGRWGSIMSLAATCGLAGAAMLAWPLRIRGFEHAGVFRALLLGSLVLGAACAAASAAVQWRTALSRLGSLKAISS